MEDVVKDALRNPGKTSVRFSIAPKQGRTLFHAVVWTGLISALSAVAPAQGAAAPEAALRGVEGKAPAAAGPVRDAASLPIPPRCSSTVHARVVVLDQVLMFNRLGAQNVNGVVYALRRDVVDLATLRPEAQGATLRPGKVQLRPDRRPRPLVLRVNKGQCLSVDFTNLLARQPNPNPRPVHHPDPNHHPELRSDDQVDERMAGFHPRGLELVNSILDDSAFVGGNPNSLIAPGQSKRYTFYAKEEGAYLVTSPAASFGGEATAGNVGNGMFAVVNVEPPGARYYRSQATEEELRLAAAGSTAQGHPILNYEARYPKSSPWIEEGKAGLPVLNMLDGSEVVHSDLNAVIVGPEERGRFGKETYPLERGGRVNPTVGNRLEPFREFTVVFHDEAVGAQAFPGWFEDPVLGHTLHGVRDAFMINYGSGGIGAEIIANRLGVGPMHDCLSCAYEEFFLGAFAVGDPAMLVDRPANLGLEACRPDGTGCSRLGPKATYAYYPDDPSNVHHSYLNDPVRFRNLHAGKEQHVFHLHAHQWLANPNDENSTYLDSQAIGPGSAYTYEIAFGGSGNRNKMPGDSIFHCHFYPHFAQGMWELWRTHDVFEGGSRLEVSGRAYHQKRWGLQSGRPAPHARALPDGEILAGTPIPAVVPIPGRPLAPTPGRVETVGKDANGDGRPESSQARVLDRDRMPGYPFYIAGIEEVVGQRATTPPLDMDPAHEGWDGGLPRHALEGGAAGGAVGLESHTRLDFTKTVERARPKYYPEGGTDLEKVAMAFNAQRCHDTFLPNGSPARCVDDKGGFITNGNQPVPGAPYADPCIDDEGRLLEKGKEAHFFGGDGRPSIRFSPQFGATNPRVYKGADIELDVVFNKVGYHFPQERIVALWEDVVPTLTRKRPPEPFVMRLNTYDCAVYRHTNLVPEYYEMDDYQVRTPSDIIGQHIHLVKFDVTSSDGSGNGWNYEDGTLSPGAVRERIEAINRYNAAAASPVQTLDGRVALKPLPHPFFGDLDPSQPDEQGHKKWDGARTTIQRWFADPILNTEGEDRGLGVVFTHDHFGPSTHQQVGLYATLLVEPEGSVWKHNETGEEFYTRPDGGPTSWQAVIESRDAAGRPVDRDRDGKFDSFREFFLEFSDFQHAYHAGVWVGRDGEGMRVCAGDETVCPDPESFRQAINPPYRKPTAQPFPDIQYFPPICPGGVPRPCPEAISADDVGMMVVNYRNEPVGLRVYDPQATGPDGKKGRQGLLLGSDLGAALQSRTDRPIAELNSPLGMTPYAPLTNDVQPGDPFTPLLRVEEGDVVRLKIQAGGYEHEHNGTIHGIKWLQAGGGFGEGSPRSGWRNSQNLGISEQATLAAPIGFKRDHLLGFVNEHCVEIAGPRFGVVPQKEGACRERTDHAYTVDASQDGWWTGVWGLLRTYQYRPKDLYSLTLREGERANSPAPAEDLAPRRLVTIDVQKVHPGFLREPITRALMRMEQEGTLPSPVPMEQIKGMLSRMGPIDLNPAPVLPEGNRTGTPKAAAAPAQGGATAERLKPGAAGRVAERVADQLAAEKIDAVHIEAFRSRLEILLRDLEIPKEAKAIEPQRLVEPIAEALRTPEAWRAAGAPEDGASSNLQTSWVDSLLEAIGPLDFMKNETLHAQKELFTDLQNLDVRSERFSNYGLTGEVKGALLKEVSSRLRQKQDRSMPGELLNPRLMKPFEAHLLKEMDQVDWSQAVWRKVQPDPFWKEDALFACPADSKLRTYRVHAVLANEVVPHDPGITLLPADSSAAMHVGGGVDPEGGTLVYNSRTTPLRRLIDRLLPGFPRRTGTEPPVPPRRIRWEVVKQGPLHDPTAIMYVLEEDLKAIRSGKQRPLPLVLRARAGECIKVVLHNDLPEDLPDLAGYTTLLQVVRREENNGDGGMTTFQNNLIRPSSEVGLHPQLVYYNMRNGDGTNVGLNPFQTVAPGGIKEIYWYAGDVRQVPNHSGPGYRFVATPVEFGGVNLTPADKIKQGQKGAVGALIIEPERAVWQADAGLRTAATVTPSGGGDRRPFRDFAAIFQKALPLRYGDATAVENIASEAGGPPGCVADCARAPEDSHDAGQMAINYRTEPMWFRYGVVADTDFLRGEPGDQGLATLPAVHRSVSLAQVGGGPETPLFQAAPGQPFRMRLLMPTGVGRATNFGLHGHVWERFPYLESAVPSQRIGHNEFSHFQSSQESLTPAAHFDLTFPCAGGRFRNKGDYLFRDNGSFGNLNGLWGIVRAEGTPQPCP